MRSIAYSDLLNRVAVKVGIAPSELNDDDRAMLGPIIQEQYEYCYGEHPWPELMAIEERATGKAPWEESETYPAGTIITYEGNFYEAAVLTTGATPAGSEDWTKLENYWPRISWEAEGKNALGDPLGVYLVDPRVYGNPRRYDPDIYPEGLRVPDRAGATVFVRYRPEPLKFSGPDYDNSATYEVDQQIYFSTDFYRCLSPTSAGQSPTTTPAKWAKVEMPRAFGKAIALLSRAGWLESDGQDGNGERSRRLGEDALDAEILKVVKQMRQRPSVSFASMPRPQSTYCGSAR
ncbi:hypothetical protein [Ruficoccus sp. ZRK36]|uniref:hypothetical protein n=1 Tax=Ruficoccus sp. ZRK36 TaxID=2866311 RepID=UPI001C73CD5B|nr:hypothetical protein [Ruficoccus sp. ZRK36]QYY35312.1 hypothetical protein K0V07_13550 [Ruficoccus sp. ZRK36]